MTVKLEKNKAHTIYRTKSGEVVPGASTIAKVDENQYHVFDWANKMGREGMDHNKVRDEAGDAGSIAHFLIHCHLNGHEPDLSEFSQKVIGLGTTAFNNFLVWWDLNKARYNVLGSELSMVSEVHRYGGTIDLVLKDSFLGTVELVECKTSKRIQQSHVIQASAYARLYGENQSAEGYNDIDSIIMLRLDRERKRGVEVKQIFDTEPYFNYFLDQLRAYRSKKALPAFD